MYNSDDKLPAWYLKNKKFTPWAYAEKVFSAEECDKIIEYGDNLLIQDAALGDGDINKDIRSNKVGWITNLDDTSEWLYRALTDVVTQINDTFWQFDLEYIAPLQYTKYVNKNDGYQYHVDIAHHDNSHYRKLSFSLQLTEENSYKGCDLVIKNSNLEEKTKRERGTINFFPSVSLHRVTPLIKGQRNCIVGWVCGPSFK